jgi:hypothetical protein
VKRIPRRALSSLAVIALGVSGSIPSLAISATSAGASPPVWHSDVRPTPTGSWFAVAYNNKTWVATGRTADIAYSADAIHWTMVPVASGSWQSLAYGKGVWVTLSSSATSPSELTSVSGKIWTSHLAPTGRWSSVTFGHGLFVAVSFDGAVMTSPDALHWTQRHAATNVNAWYAVTYGNGRFVAVDGDHGDTMVSTNGVNWTIHHPADPSYAWGAVAYGNGTFVAFDDNATSLMATSVDGALWTTHHYGFAGSNYSGTFGCNQFVSVTSFSSTAHYQTSSTGTTWSSTPTSIDQTGANWAAVGYGNGKYVAANDVGDITWSAAPSSCKQAIPNPPTDIHGTVGAGSLAVSWSPPAYGGVKTVSSYVVKLTSGTSVKRCYSTTTTCNFHSLLTRHTYVVNVTAVNGAHLFSVPSDPITIYSALHSSFSVTPLQPVYLMATAASAWVTSAPNGWLVTGQVGATKATCLTNGFGQCLLHIIDSGHGQATLQASYTASHVTHHAPAAHYSSLRVVGIAPSYPNGGDMYVSFAGGVPNVNASLTINGVTTSSQLDSLGAGTVMAVAPASGTSASIVVSDDGVYIETVVIALTV